MSKIEIVSASAKGSDARWLRWLDAEMFPGDTPFQFELADWFIAWDGPVAAAYCGWKQVMQGVQLVGYHYRAGVMKTYRGRGLQARMIKVRERAMRKVGLLYAATYTSADNAPSMRSLINAGYRPYIPSAGNALTTAHGFVHWGKRL